MCTGFEYVLAKSLAARNKHDIRRGLFNRHRLRTLLLPERVRLEEDVKEFLSLKAH